MSILQREKFYVWREEHSSLQDMQTLENTEKSWVFGVMMPADHILNKNIDTAKNIPYQSLAFARRRRVILGYH